MKQFTLLFLLSLSLLQLRAETDSLFTGETLRIDYIHSGTANDETFALEALIREAVWAGPQHNLTDAMHYGNHRVMMHDADNGSLLFSRGYSSLFAEWQTTAEAGQLVKAFEETVVVPFPVKPVLVSLWSRMRETTFSLKLRFRVDPDSYFIRPAVSNPWEVYEVQVSRPADQAVDIVIIPDGFTAGEMELFKKAADRFADNLFGFEPFGRHRERFNIRAVLAPSAESGVAIPADGIWPNTVVSSSFYTFDSERYCMTHDHHRLRDLASAVPYDQIYILTNTKKYGGGGIYNFYCLSSALNESSPEIIVHEFGHGFAGLGDEYYDSSTSYESFYRLDIEPWEPNITTLVNFDAKWKPLIDLTTPVPTPDEAAWDGITGVYEGGGYVPKGIYRPSRDCLMHTFKNDLFCQACSEAIEKMIFFFTDGK